MYKYSRNNVTKPAGVSLTHTLSIFSILHKVMDATLSIHLHQRMARNVFLEERCMWHAECLVLKTSKMKNDKERSGNEIKT